MFSRMKQDRETPESTPRPSDALDSITSVTIVAPADARAYVGELLSVPNGRGGWIDANDVVFIEGKDGHRTLLPNAAADQSPTGFSWGYAGSGPSALARSILAHRLGETNGTTDLSWLLLDDFRSDIMRLPHRQSFRLEAVEIDAWIASWLGSPRGKERLDRALKGRRSSLEHEERLRALAREYGHTEKATRPVSEIGHDLAEALQRGDEVAVAAYWRELSTPPDAGDVAPLVRP